MNAKFVRLLLALGSLASLSRADDLPASFAWRQPLADSVKTGKLYRFHVPPAVFSGSQAFPTDIRILDSATNQWPFFIWAPAPSEDIEAVPVETLNKSRDAGPDRYLRVDLRVRSSGAKTNDRPRHDRVTINTGGAPYLRRVEVLGSEDGAAWAHLASGYLIDQKRDVPIVNRTVFYPPSDYARLQVRVFPNAANADEEIPFIAASIARTTRTEGEMEELELNPVDATNEPAEDATQVVVLDQGIRGRPVAHLRLQVAGKTEYTRSVRVYGRNETTNAWRWAAEGSVMRFGDQDRNLIDLKDAPYRYFKLELFRGDDAPLQIERVVGEAVPRYIVFEGGHGSRPALYYGSDRVPVPQYDLERRTTVAAIRSASEVDVGTPEPLHAAIPGPDYSRWIGIGAVGAVSVMVILVVVNMIRRKTEEKPET